MCQEVDEKSSQLEKTERFNFTQPFFLGKHIQRQIIYMPRGKPNKPAQLESKGHIAESAIQSAFIQIIAKGEGTEFNADDVVSIASRTVPVSGLKGTLSRKLGLGFRKLKALRIIFQVPGLAIKSSRNDGSLLQVWKVGRVEPLKSDKIKARSNFDPSTNPKGDYVQRKAKAITP